MLFPLFSSENINPFSFPSQPYLNFRPLSYLMYMYLQSTFLLLRLNRLIEADFFFTNTSFLILEILSLPSSEEGGGRFIYMKITSSDPWDYTPDTFPAFIVYTLEK